MKNYGGKANSLLKLKENKINIPEFFIIDEQEYIQFLNDNYLVKKIESLFEEKKNEEIIRNILNGRFDDKFIFKIKKNLEN